jgi:hypothetical protein
MDARMNYLEGFLSRMLPDVGSEDTRRRKRFAAVDAFVRTFATVDLHATQRFARNVTRSVEYKTFYSACMYCILYTYYKVAHPHVFVET